jgi:hypothetical protein
MLAIVLTVAVAVLIIAESVCACTLTTCKKGVHTGFRKICELMNMLQPFHIYISPLESDNVLKLGRSIISGQAIAKQCKSRDHCITIHSQS